MYELNYSPIDGKVQSIQKDSNISIPLCEDNTDYQDFLIWNKAQPKESRLDLNSTIEPVEPVDSPDTITLKKFLADPHSGLPDLETAFQALVRLYLGVK